MWAGGAEVFGADGEFRGVVQVRAGEGVVAAAGFGVELAESLGLLGLFEGGRRGGGGGFAGLVVSAGVKREGTWVRVMKEGSAEREAGRDLDG